MSGQDHDHVVGSQSPSRIRRGKQSPAEGHERLFELGLIKQVEKVRALLALFVLAVVLTAPEPLVSNRAAALGAVLVALFATVGSLLLRNMRVLWARERLRLAAGLLLLMDVAWISSFLYSTGGFLSPFDSLLLLVLLFAAVFFGGLPTALPSVAWIVAMVYLCFATMITPNAASTWHVTTWHISGRLLGVFTLAWLAYGIARVLERERRANENVIRNLTEGVLLIDGDQTIALVNPEIEKLCNLPSELLVGRSVRHLPRKPTYQALLEIVADVNHTPDDGMPVRRDATLQQAEPVDLRITTIPCAKSGSHALGWVVVCQDITDMKAAARMRDEGMAILSHELRSPLGTLRAVTHVLSTLADNLRPEQQASYVGAIDRETTRLVNLVSMLLDVSSLERETCELHLQPLRIEEFVKDLVSVFELKAHSRGVCMVSECERGLPEVRADASRIEQVLVNLCENALKYTPEGGTIKIGVARSDGHVQIAVSDTGCGIPGDKLEAIFEKFGQADEAAGIPLVERGVGLGLHIARMIVRLHGGQMKVDSVVGAGSTFYVLLPTAAEPT